MAQLKTKQCRCCDGTGKEMDDIEVGWAMRKQRIAAKLSQSEVAHRMKVTASYVCDLEYGKRKWTDLKISLYQKACQ